MKKFLWEIPLALSLVSGAGAEEKLLNGGKLVPIDSSVIHASTGNLNFCFAERYSDGSIHLNHSMGIHTVSETGCSDISPDNGKTWKCVRNTGSCGFNSFESRDKKKLRVAVWDHKQQKTHTIETQIFDDAAQKTAVLHRQEIELPYPSQVFAHRDVVRLRDGRLLLPAYGQKQGAKGSHSFLLESADDGKTWRWISAIAEDPDGKLFEGPNETAVMELADGRIIAAYRENGGEAPMKQRVSTDGGRTWGEAVEIAPFSASPHGLVLADGTVVIVAGRPGFYLLIDFTGKGENYQRVPIYRGSGSSYGSVVETAPGELLLIYDESDFGTGHAPGFFSRIHADRFKLVKDASITDGSGDPRKGDYTMFYTPASGKLPQQLGLFAASAYGTKSGSAPAWAEIMEIPERPLPVLRVASLGDNTGRDGYTWSTFLSVEKADAHPEKLEVGFELRLHDDGTDNSCFMVSGAVRPDPEKPARTAYVQFSRDHLSWIDAGMHKVKFDFNAVPGSFNRFRLVLDGASGVWRLYANDAAQPVITAKLAPYKGAGQCSAVSFGDGSRLIRGIVDLSYIGWK